MSSGENLKVVALAGGTGSAKLLKGLARSVSNLTVVANVGDNYWFQGLYVCPDVDISVYSLAGIADEQKGWGIKGDTFTILGQISKLGGETWFKMGDLDIATSMIRTDRIRSGASLTAATLAIAKALGCETPILPATDSPVETLMDTQSGTMHLQEFWVKRRGRPRVFRVRYSGADKASPTRQVKAALASADRVVFCPANPITSIGPILAIQGMKERIARSRSRVVALSPMVGRRPYSGPAGKLMRELGLRSDSVGVAKLYEGLLDALVIDKKDAPMRDEIEKMGVSTTIAGTLIRDASDARRLASVLLTA